jgi:hypothetical protein
VTTTRRPFFDAPLRMTGVGDPGLVHAFYQNRSPKETAVSTTHRLRSARQPGLLRRLGAPSAEETNRVINSRSAANATGLSGLIARHFLARYPSIWYAAAETNSHADG